MVLQWLNDLVYLCFTIVLLIISGLLLSGHTVAIRPLVGPTVLLPGALLVSGLLRAVWALRQRTHVTYRRALLAFINWLSLSWTVALACIQGLIRREGVFLRTPKTESHDKLSAALLAARSETALWLLLWASAIALAVHTHPTALLLGLLAWQGVVYAAAPLTSWLAQRTQLSPDLERRRRSEETRERLIAVLRPVAAGSVVLSGLAACAFVIVLSLGATNPGHPSNPFVVPQRSGSAGPWGVVPVSNNASPPPPAPPQQPRPRPHQPRRRPPPCRHRPRARRRLRPRRAARPALRRPARPPDDHDRPAEALRPHPVAYPVDVSPAWSGPPAGCARPGRCAARSR